jgi:hypothetical protein
MWLIAANGGIEQPDGSSCISELTLPDPLQPDGLQINDQERTICRRRLGGRGDTGVSYLG